MHCASEYSVAGGVSISTMSYSDCALASSAPNVARDSSSSGFGGSGPAGSTDRPVRPVTGAAADRSARPDSALERPNRSGTLKMLCWRGARKSASISRVRCPSWEKETARLAATKLRPSRAQGLAISFSQLGQRTLLIDADFRAPRQQSIFNVPDRFGLSSALSGRAELSTALPVSGLTGLSVLPAGPVPPNPLELLSRASFAALLAKAQCEYDIIIIDTPPLGLYADAQCVA